jgi:hypothetical protein
MEVTICNNFYMYAAILVANIFCFAEVHLKEEKEDNTSYY